jgi:hypothetical protein
LDNFEEKETEQQTEQQPEQEIEQRVEEDLNDDIQFEETIDIDELQKQLQQQIEQGNTGLTPEEEIPTEFDQKPLVSKKQVDPRSKKYVIYINPDNVDYMENLSLDERKDMINKILKEQNDTTIKHKILEARKHLVANVILSCLTFVICFPLLFMLVNKATEVSIDNYNQAKGNFVKLYRAQGKIKSYGLQ